MPFVPFISSFAAKTWLIAALPLAALACAAPLPVAAQNGSENPSFQRHFWRGQNNHGNIDFEARRTTRPTGPATAEALVEEGTRGAAIAESARSCASRFRSYDPATGTYIGVDGRPRACR